ncbi:hypothetical protein D3C76_1294490 [compost metagenome]
MGQFEHAVDQFIDARSRFTDRLRQHVRRRRHQFARLVFDDIAHGTVLVGGAHLVQGRCRFGVVADGAGHARPIDFRRQGRRDADQADRLAGLGKGFGQGQDVRLNSAAGSFDGEIGEVLG